MAGGIHASSPGSATVTHQMGHTVLAQEYTLNSTILENGVNETSRSVDVNVGSSTSRKRKHSADGTNSPLESKRTCIFNQLLNDMIIEKEKFMYISLLHKYSYNDENDFFNIIDKNIFPYSVLPFPNPQQPKTTYFASESEQFKKLFSNELVTGLKPLKLVKQETNDSKPCSASDPNFKVADSVSGGRFRTSSTSGENSHHIVDKAKQEAYVLQRVAELQKCGMWSEKRLPKVQEPPRTKAHWDYVLEELKWLATDFAEERKYKKRAARMRSRMVQKHFQERETLVQKAARAAELHKRKIASHLAKMVKSFWNNVEKVVDFKQQSKLKEKRQRALDQHLSFIVDKTEQYSSLVAESMNKSSMPAQSNSRPLSPASDVEFEPNQSSSDDEETIEAEERKNLKDAVDHSKEIEMLEKESELPLEDLLSQLPPEYFNNKHLENDDECGDSEDDSTDDESMIYEDDKGEKALSESEMRKKNMKSAAILEDFADSPLAGSSSDTDEGNSNDDDSEDIETDDDEKMMEGENDGLRSLIRDRMLENGDVADENADEKIDDVAAIAESIQPKGNTLSSTCVVTKVPFLLKHSLREYQHIGLDWLVTMYERKLNGILADEMGLGKTIQTIALLAHLASDKESWGPHLIIVPTSVMLNWEMEFKKWCPAFKILTYYGNPKERRLKRTGWTKPNTFHVCITSYKLVLQDHHCFRRKKWKYLILDEAQNIKNFKSQRWQRLLNFDSERRLLLTGTPLQNNLMELWSLMHFLMPNLFSSHREFKEWFSNPVTGMIEGNSEYNENIIKRLHKVLRPFLLRRLKIEVEKQLPSKYEHIVMCRLSNRQRYLYDDFMSRAKTKETLSSGSLLSVINVLMQLRKVCNHPNLFEPRPIISPFQMESITYHTSSLIDSALDYDPFRHVSLNALNLRLIDLEELSAWSVYRLKKLKVPRKLIEEIDDMPGEPPPVPNGKVNIHLKTPNNLNNIIIDNNVKNNQKIITCLKKVSSLNANSSNNIGRQNSLNVNSVKYAPIFRSVLGQGEINNMAVKRVKTVDNSIVNRGSYTLQVKGGIKGSTGAQKICIATSTGTPIHATVLKNVIPVSIKNTQSSSESVSSNSTTYTVNCNTISLPSTSGSCSTVVSSSVSASQFAAVSTNSSTKVIPNSKPQIFHSSSSKPIILTSSAHLPSANLAKSQPSASVKTTSGQRLILTKSATGSFEAITRLESVRPFIRIPNSSVQQATILNNGASSTISSSVPSTIILNNSMKTSVPVSKPVSTSTVSAPSTSSAVTRSRSEKSREELVPEANEIKDRRAAKRKNKLRILADINERKSSPYVMFGCDVRSTLKVLDSKPSCPPPMDNSLYWRCTGHVNCINVQYAKHIHNLCYTLTNALSNSVRSIEERIQELSETFSRFIVYVPAVNARRPSMHVSHPHPSKAWSLSYMECSLEKHLAPRSRNLHQIVSRMSTAFPDSRLIQYDCGKLQVLDTLLRRLKVEQHRVLIFTQMARMLDVLEAFLTFHGHIYLRLDGSTRIDQRQLLMERFNADKRYFCFILSTRSGGIGVNLTGADTVIFYDSDWNPTMDAQAQDRCHRIGQTRDVHIYRLISERTVEENILKKANQKKLLGDLAIEGGNFTAAYFKSSTIHDLFNVDLNETDPAKRINDNFISSADASGSQTVEKSTLNAYENALAIAEDETDVTAARTAKEEAVAELAEFDENIPLVDNDGNADASLPMEEFSKSEQEVNALIEQLTPIERWALTFMETVDAEWAEEQLAAAEAEIEQQKKEWEMERLAIEQADERSKRVDDDEDDDEDELLTYASEDAKNQIWLSIDKVDCMPIWLPLPPICSMEECEYYVDRSLKYLYETTCIPEHQLPPIYFRKEKKKRLDQSSSSLISDGASHIRVRNRHRDGLSSGNLSVGALEPPRSLFDRPSQIVIKLRHDMRLQKYRGLSRSSIQNVPGLKPYFPPKVNVDPEFVPEWLIHEDYALLQAIQHVQELPLNLAVMYPGHVPNWDLVSELVNQVSRIYRSPQQCKNRFESAILPREEGKLTSDPIMKKHKKLKGVNTSMSHTKFTRNYKTAQLFMQDGNSTFTQMMNTRFDAIRVVSNRRSPTITRLPLTTSTRNTRHAEIVAENEIDYDSPLTPVEIATRRAQRLAKEKQTQMGNSQQQQQQQQVTKQPAASSSSTTTQPAVQQSLQAPQVQTQIAAHKTVPISTANLVSQGQTAVVVNVSQNASISAASPVITRTIVGQPIAVQEMIVANKSQAQPSSSDATTTSVVAASPQKFRTIPQISTASTVTMPRLADGKIITSAQFQLHRQQPAIQLRQTPQQFTIFHSRNKTPVVVPTSVVVSSPPQQQQRQIKTVAGSVTTPPVRSVTETEMNALLKKQQQSQPSHSQQPKITTVIASSNSSSVPTQFITGPVTATAGKTTVGIPIPTIKTTLSASSLKATPGSTQQFRHIAIPQPIQQRKFTTQKVTPIGQVMVNVTQSGGQVISQVLTKGTPATAAQLVKIPFYTSQSGAKQTIQVVTASALRAATASSVTVDSSGTRHIQPSLPANAIKISGGGSAVNVTTLTPQQHFLNQVSAALQNNQPLAVRRIQSAGIASNSASTASATATSSSPNQIITIPTTQSQQTTSSEKKVQP